MKKPILAVGFLSATVLSGIAPTTAQNWESELNKVYMDESHCLVAPEIRSDKDNPISCYCRDAIVDARYVYFTYLLPGKDSNLSGIFLALQGYAGEMCSRDTAERLSPGFISKIHAATMEENWKWDGPEVVRTYPPDDVIQQIKPDTRGLISVRYAVVVLQRDSQGRVIKTESFSAEDIMPASVLNRRASPQAPPKQ